jgi:VanZ family protein
MTVTVATLAFACEFAQRYLPGRTAEITSVLLALGMGWLIAALTPIHQFKRGNPGISR